MESAAQGKMPIKTEPSWNSVSVENAPWYPVFIKDEPPSEYSVEIRSSCLDVSIKEEILNTDGETSGSNATEEPLDVTVKVERVKAECGVSACAAAAGLYAGHAVTGELVLGPTLVERQETTSKPKGPAPQEEQGKILDTYRCDHCSFTTARKSTLVSHMKIHTNSDNTVVYKNKHTEKPHKCDQCNYAAARESTLLVHKRKHTGAKPYKCGQCSYATAYKCALPAHERIHTGEKPYKCDRCSYATVTKSNLRHHERTHTRGIPYKCDRCSYATAHKAYLLRHARLHSGEPPFKCETASYKSIKEEENCTNVDNAVMPLSALSQWN